MRFAGKRQEDAEVARRAVVVALYTLSPAIGQAAAEYLSASVIQLADGSKQANILTIGRADRVRHDPMSRSRAIMMTRIAAEVLRTRARSGNPATKAEALGLLRRLGIHAEKPRGGTGIERALLEACGHPLEEDAWDRAKATLSKSQKEAVIMASRLLLGELTNKDDDTMHRFAYARESIHALAKNADPAALDQLTAHLRYLWQR
jgi:hypothetical protein